jgi:hypothetical protein
MRDIVSIIVAERRTLFRGFVVSFLFILPFTFLPLLGGGFTWMRISERFPLSVVYTLGFSFLVVLFAVIQNYQNLVERKRLFDKPAFKKLQFYGRLDGLGSIVHELETFLLGKVGNYYFRLNIIDPGGKTIQVEIVPFMDIEGNKELEKKLKKGVGFRQNRFFGLSVKATESDLDDEDFLLDKLVELERALTKLGVKALDVEAQLLREQEAK